LDGGTIKTEEKRYNLWDEREMEKGKSFIKKRGRGREGQKRHRGEIEGGRGLGKLVGSKAGGKKR